MVSSEDIREEIQTLVDLLISNLQLDGGPDSTTYTDILLENVNTFNYDVDLVGDAINCLCSKGEINKKELRRVYRELLVDDIHYANLLIYFLSNIQNQPHLLYVLGKDWGLNGQHTMATSDRTNAIGHLHENIPSSSLPITTDNLSNNVNVTEVGLTQSLKRYKKTTPLIKKSLKVMVGQKNTTESEDNAPSDQQISKSDRHDDILNCMHIESRVQTKDSPINPKPKLSRTSTTTIDKEMSKLNISIKFDEESHQHDEAYEHSQMPKLPAWFVSRKYMKYQLIEYDDEEQIYLGNTPNTILKQQLKDVDINIQEVMAIEDLLFLFIGTQGKFIHLFNENNAWVVKISSSYDMSIKELISSVIPLVGSFQTISNFINEVSPLYEGRVAQALSEAIETLLREYMAYICGLESQHKEKKLTLQSLVTHAHSCINQLQPLERLCKQLNKGPLSAQKVIDVLYESYQLSQCAGISNELFNYLLDKACTPFFESLQKWIHEGLIYDPYDEFMVESNEVTLNNIEDELNDVFWEKKYVLSQTKTPFFLQPIADKILSTGKYINVIRQFDKNFNFDANPTVPIELTKDYSCCMKIVESAHNQASACLLQLLVEEKKLLPYLRSLKHYFMFDQGDFYVLLMDHLGCELEKTIHDVNIHRLESSVEIALSLSVCSSDPYKDDLKVVLLPTSLQAQLSSINSVARSIGTVLDDKSRTSNNPVFGYETFSFNFDVPWPLSLVVDRKALIKYQMLFRLIFLVKRVERLHTKLWEKCVQQQSKKSYHFPQELTFYKMLLSVNNKMLHFIQTFEYYLAFEVIEPNWQNLEYHLTNVNNVDQVIQYHGYFLAQCIAGFLLNNEYLIERIFAILSLSEEFCSSQMVIFEEHSTDNFSSFVTTHQNQLADYDARITQLLVKLIQLLRDDKPLSSELNNNSLASRIDQNGFYSSTINNPKNYTIMSTTI